MPIKPERKGLWRILSSSARAARVQVKYPLKECAQCGSQFRPYFAPARFCSVICNKRFQYQRNNPKKTKQCGQCGEAFIPKKSNGRKYCAPICKDRAMRRLANPSLLRLRRQRYSKTETYRLGQKNHKARRRSAERIGSITQIEWDRICAIYEGCCAYCHIRAKLTIDHIRPLSKGGIHVAENIVPACRSCNSAKGNRDWSSRLAAN